MKNKSKNFKVLKWIFGLSVFLFILPSIIYFVRCGNSVFIPDTLEYRFFLDDNIDRKVHMVAYVAIILMMTLIYYFIIKKRNVLFKGIKDVYKYIIVISIICIFSIPFMSSDIFYYIGIGRLSSKYGQNPYYVDMKSYVEDNNIDTSTDSVMDVGYKNYWAGTTVVYGALWSFICTIVAFFSFGSINIGILIFKMINVLIHIFNCILLYKISKKKIFPLIYGLNPFILIEGIINVHNDIFMVFFMLLAIYEMYKKKQIYLALIALACATAIKYVAVLLLPVLIIYNFREENVKVRILKCIKYGIIFVVFVMIPYLLYIRDFEVFKGLVTQQTRYAKGLYCYLFVKFPNYKYLGVYIRGLSIYAFALLYIFICIKLLISKKIKFYKEMRKNYYVFLFFLFFMLTNFQPWYFMWLSIFLIWQKPQNIKLLTQMQLLTIFSNAVFVRYSEMYLYTEYFFEIFVIGILVCFVLNKIFDKYRKKA